VLEAGGQIVVEVADLGGELAQGTAQVLFADGLAGGGTQGLGVADLPAVRISALKVLAVAVRVLVACSRVASRILRASRVSPVRGRAWPEAARAWRAARTASSSSDLPPRRRVRRGRSASMTRCPALVSARARPAPCEPQPSIAQAVPRPAACSAAKPARRA
jgi:hypothetical protein